MIIDKDTELQTCKFCKEDSCVKDVAGFDYLCINKDCLTGFYRGSDTRIPVSIKIEVLKNDN